MNSNDTAEQQMIEHDVKVQEALEAMTVLSEKRQKLMKSRKKDGIITLIVIAITFVLVGIYFMASEAGTGDYIYKGVDKRVDVVSALPPAKSRDDFLAYVQSSLTDDKITTWEFVRIGSKYDTAIAPSEKAKVKEMATIINDKAEIARQSN